VNVNVVALTVIASVAVDVLLTASHAVTVRMFCPLKRAIGPVVQLVVPLAIPPLPRLFDQVGWRSAR
jgi:hypothetical protein